MLGILKGNSNSLPPGFGGKRDLANRLGRGDRSPLCIWFWELDRVLLSLFLVLIAIEIFVNIRLYLGADVLPVQLVIATALMAICRKIIEAMGGQIFARNLTPKGAAFHIVLPARGFAETQPAPL